MVIKDFQSPPFVRMLGIIGFLGFGFALVTSCLNFLGLPGPNVQFTNPTLWGKVLTIGVCGGMTWVMHYFAVSFTRFEINGGNFEIFGRKLSCLGSRVWRSYQAEAILGIEICKKQCRSSWYDMYLIFSNEKKSWVMREYKIEDARELASKISHALGKPLNICEQ